MPKTHPCTHCEKIFARAYQLKKHIITHEDPDSLYYCPECEFFSCQKKNLVIHFALHTGEKVHKCPDMIHHPGSDGSPPRVDCCDYKTNDPAALTKHRKKKHGYVPPNRTCGKAISTLPKPEPRRRQDGANSRRYHPYERRVTPVPPSREPSLVQSMASSSDSSPGPASICSESTEDPSPFIWQGDLNEYEWPAGTDLLSNMFGCEASLVGSSKTSITPDNTKLDTVYDPTLDPYWMAQYETVYSSFDMTGMSYVPEPFDVASLFSDPLASNVGTGCEGSLCPDLMVQAGIEGWDRSVLDTHKELYGFDA